MFKNKLIQILVMFNFVLTISGDIQNMEPVQWGGGGGIGMPVSPSVSNSFMSPPYLLNPLNDFR